MKRAQPLGLVGLCHTVTISLVQRLLLNAFTRSPAVGSTKRSPPVSKRVPPSASRWATALENIRGIAGIEYAVHVFMGAAVNVPHKAKQKVRTTFSAPIP